MLKEVLKNITVDDIARRKKRIRLVDVPAGVTQEAVLALITFIARRTQPFLSLVDREIDFFVLMI